VKRGDGWLVAAIGAALLWLSLRRGTVTFGPVEAAAEQPRAPRTVAPGEAEEAAASRRRLCECAPLRSFGSACEGLTWLTLPTLSLGMAGGWQRVDLRDKLPATCGR